MTFGMMFGANQNAVDEWSTDDDGDGDYDDDDCDDDDNDCDDEEEYIPDEYFDEYPAMGSGGPLPMQMPLPPNMQPHPPSHHMGSIHAAMKGKLNQQPGPPNAAPPATASWEPQVKQYSNMNLKDQLNKQRMQMQQDEPDDNSDAGEHEVGEETEAERERKLKLAKKRAEKRKKQKEKDKKKTKESADNNATANEGTLNAKDFVDYTLLDPEHLQKYVKNRNLSAFFGQLINSPLLPSLFY